MSAEGSPNRRFEPPPWEKEAFERFEQEKAKQRTAEELEEQLRALRQPSTPSPEEAPPPAPGMQDGSAGGATGAVTSGQADPAMQGRPIPEEAAAGRSVAPPSVAVPESKIQAMLVELRLEEPSPVQVNMTLINSVIGVFSVIGVIIVVQAALLFAQARSSDAAATMLAATMSFVVLLAGLGFITGAILLFRKYHR